MRHLPLLLAALLLSACANCHNKKLSTVRSPDGKWDAITFQRGCGKGAMDTTQVSVVKAKKSLPKASGNAFVADTGDGQAKAEAWGGPKADAAWTPESALSVSYDPAARVFACAKRVGPVPVQCAPVKTP